MMVDISHTADKTFYDALEVSTAPSSPPTPVPRRGLHTAT